MNKIALSVSISLLAGALLATAADLKDDVKAAAQKLAAKGSYSWKSTTDMGPNARFRPGPTEGKTQKDGCVHLTMTRGDNTTEAILKGDKGAVKMDAGWQSLEELSQSEGGDGRPPGRFLAGMLRNIKAPAVQAEELLGKVKELKKTEEGCGGDLTEQGAKDQMTFGRPRAGGDGPAISDAKGSVKFWIKDGLLVKYELKVQGKITLNDRDMDVDRTTTVEIKNVGSTKVELPDEAKKKMS